MGSLASGTGVVSLVPSGHKVVAITTPHRPQSCSGLSKEHCGWKYGGGSQQTWYPPEKCGCIWWGGGCSPDGKQALHCWAPVHTCLDADGSWRGGPWKRAVSSPSADVKPRPEAERSAMACQPHCRATQTPGLRAGNLEDAEIQSTPGANGETVLRAALFRVSPAVLQLVRRSSGSAAAAGSPCAGSTPSGPAAPSGTSSATRPLCCV